MAKLYYQDALPTIYHGDCLEGMKELPDELADLLCTDPPYGLSFMGKDWDKAVPSVRVWRECLRVLKPGAFAFVMCIPRQDCLGRMIANLQDAGFDTGFTSIYWAYASGFPKAQNIGKAVDKRKGTHPDKSKEFAEHIKTKRLELGIGLTQADEYVCGGTTNYSWFEGRPAGQRLPRLAEYECIKELLGLGNTFDEFIGEAEREVIGQSDHKSGIGNEVKGHYTVGGTKAEFFDITSPATPQAKALDGSYGGFQPKPAVEVILVCMKPLSEKTYVDQALKNQKGITWLDDGRIPYINEQDIGDPDRGKGYPMLDPKKGWNQNEIINTVTIGEKGRFAANLLVSDDVLDDGRILFSAGKYNHPETSPGKKYFGRGEKDNKYAGDSGTFSRYFSLDQWAQRTFPFLIVPKASKAEKNRGVSDIEAELGHNRFDQCANCGGYILQNPDRPSACKCEKPVRQHNKVRGNYHPTCKPLKLMSYLITLGTREGDTVLDPFVGSGTTCLAAKMLNRKSIGFEIHEPYCEIAAKRCQQDIQAMMITED